jgi:hypothetical protein
VAVPKPWPRVVVAVLAVAAVAYPMRRHVVVAPRVVVAALMVVGIAVVAAVIVADRTAVVNAASC